MASWALVSKLKSLKPEVGEREGGGGWAGEWNTTGLADRVNPCRWCKGRPTADYVAVGRDTAVVDHDSRAIDAGCDAKHLGQHGLVPFDGVQRKAVLKAW